MIFIAKGVDFSANRIGKVALSYSQKTNDVLLAYNNPALTTDQKDKVNDLIVALTDNGIMTKITHLYLPILSPTLAKSLVNIAKASNPIDAVPNPANYALDVANKGIYNNVTGVPLNITLASAENLSNKNYHYLAFNTSINETNASYPSVIDSANTSLYMNFTGGTDIYMSGNTKLGGVNIHAITNLPNNTLLYRERSLKGLSTNSLNGFSILSRNTVKDFTYSTPIATETFLPTLTLNLASSGSVCMRASQGLISMGKGLTNAELVIYNTYASELIKSFGVAVYV